MSRIKASAKPSDVPPTQPAFRLKPLAIAVMAVHSPLAAVAQEQTEVEDTGRTIEEVIVTATKREANMQDVAQSITAFTTDDLERLRARALPWSTVSRAAIPWCSAACRPVHPSTAPTA